MTDMTDSREKNNNTFSVLLWSLFTLSIPTVVEQLLSVLMIYVDTAMVGRLGEEATAAVSTTGSVNWLIGGMSAAFGVAAMSQISRAVGEGDEEYIKRVAAQTFIGATVIGLILEVTCLGLSPFIPVWMGTAREVRPNASLYFFIISLPQLIKSWGIIFASAIRATKDTKNPMIISLVANGMNIALNYLFIYGLGLGVTGAAIGTAISASFSGLMMFRIFRKNKMLRFDFSIAHCCKRGAQPCGLDQGCRHNSQAGVELKFEGQIMKHLLSMFFPVLASNVASGFAYVVFASMVSRMGTTVFAAHAIAINAEQLFYIAGYGLKSSTSTMVGIACGEKNYKKFRQVTAAGYLMVLALMTINGLVLYVFAYPLMTVFTSSVTVAALGAGVLKMVALSEPAYGIGVVAEGIYYGLGKSNYPLFVVLFSMWGIRIVSTWICLNFFNADLNMVWACMIADNMVRSALLFLPMLRRGFGYSPKNGDQMPI